MVDRNLGKIQESLGRLTPVERNLSKLSYYKKYLNSANHSHNECNQVKHLINNLKNQHSAVVQALLYYGAVYQEIDEQLASTNPDYKSDGICREFSYTPAKPYNEKKSYIRRSWEQFIYGDYSDEVTLLGTGGQVLLAFTGLDAPADIRDFSANIEKKNYIMAGVCLVSLLPVVGGFTKGGKSGGKMIKSSIKSGKSATKTIKASSRLVKVLPDVAKVGKVADTKIIKKGNRYVAEIIKRSKHLDEIASASKKVFKHSDDVSKATMKAGKHLDDVITDGSHIVKGKLKPNFSYIAGENKYLYKTNNKGLISHVKADKLQLKKHGKRLNHAKNTPGKLKKDHAGHLMADLFGGSPQLDNLVSQSQKVNLSRYKKIENTWANALKNNKKVTNVDIKLEYGLLGKRPKKFKIIYEIDNVPYSTVIKNK